MRVLVVIVLMLAVPVVAAAKSNADDALSCIILPDEQVDLGSPVPGVIEHIGVRRSDRVRAGQPIARLESSVEQATVALAQARAATDTEIELRRVEYGYDAQHRNRLNTLQARQAVSSQNLEDAEKVAQAAQLRVRLAQDKRREARLDKKRADAMLALKTIVSPIDGVVLQLHNRVGEYVESRPVVRIARLDPLRVEVIAPLALFGSVEEGMQIAVRPETDPGHERVATVTAVDAVADPGSGTFGVQLTLPNPGHGLPAGIKCTGRLLPPAQASAGEPVREPVRTNLQAAASRNTLLTPTLEREPASANAKAAFTATAMPPQAPVQKPVNKHENVSVTTAAAKEHSAEQTHSCLAFGPQDDKQQARDLVAVAEQLGARAGLQEIEAPRVFGYVVVSPQIMQPGRLHRLMAKMRDAGVKDLAIINRGEYSGRIALGTYNGPISAERRSVALNQLGFDTEVLPRTRTEPAWQVEVRLPQQTDRSAVLAQLRRVAGELTGQSRACDHMLSAAR